MKISLVESKGYWAIMIVILQTSRSIIVFEQHQHNRFIVRIVAKFTDY
ncbi:MAG: hypothetical protein K6L75_12025 [Cellvibrionaceae bacterium]